MTDNVSRDNHESSHTRSQKLLRKFWPDPDKALRDFMGGADFHPCDAFDSSMGYAVQLPPNAGSRQIINTLRMLHMAGHQMGEQVEAAQADGGSELLNAYQDAFTLQQENTVEALGFLEKYEAVLPEGELDALRESISERQKECLRLLMPPGVYEAVIKSAEQLQDAARDEGGSSSEIILAVAHVNGLEYVVENADGEVIAKSGHEA